MDMKTRRRGFKADAKAKVKANFGQGALVYVFMILLSFVIMGGEALTINGVINAATFSWLTSVLSLFVLVPIEIGCASFFLKQSRGENPTFKSVFDGFSSAYARNLGSLILSCVPILIACIIYGIVITLLLVGLGPESAAAVVAAIVWTLVFYVFLLRYAYGIYLISFQLAESELGSFNALKEIYMKTKGHRWELFVCDLSFIPWALFVCITCGIGIIYVGPYMMTTYANYYNDIKNN